MRKIQYKNAYGIGKSYNNVSTEMSSFLEKFCPNLPRK